MTKLLVQKFKNQKSLSVLTVLSSSALLNLGCFSEARAASIRPSFTLNPSPPAAANLVNLGDSFVLGYNFVIDLDSKLNNVGIFVPTSTGHTIGIWDAANYTDTNPVLGPLLWQKQIADINSCQTISSYCWFSVNDSPTFTANNKYVVASTWGSENVPYRLNTTTAVPTPGIPNLSPSFTIARTAITGDAISSGLLVDFSLPAIAPSYTPNDSDPASAVGFLSVNLSFADSTPLSQTPAPLPLFGAAAAFGLSRKLRRRISAAS